MLVLSRSFARAHQSDMWCYKKVSKEEDFIAPAILFGRDG